MLKLIWDIVAIKKIKFINLIFLFIFLFIFFLAGAFFYKNSYWPFGKGIYGGLISVFGTLSFSSNENDISNQNKDIYRTTAHLIKAQAIPYDYKTQQFDHIEISNELNQNEIEIFGIKGNKSESIDVNSKPNNLVLSKIVVDVKKEKINSQIILEIENNYRATDILITDDKRTFISYLTKNQEGAAALKIVEIIKLGDKFTYSEIFSTHYVKPNSLPAMIQSGGKMIQFSKNEILIGIGDFALWRYTDETMGSYPHINEEFGKTILVNMNTKESNFYSTGHRNPQGLLKDSSRILLTEHGPEGGDEINLIEYGKNYGWPYVSYGANYGKNPESEKYSNGFGIHKKYTEPIFSFIPSIGIKAIAKMPMNEKEFKKWSGNYLICSTKGILRAEITKGSLPKLIFTELLADNVTFQKPKKIVEGCRDLVITSQGLIITNQLIMISKPSDERLIN